MSSPQHKARQVTVRVRREHVFHDTGHWCNPCASSSGVRLVIAVILNEIGDGPGGMHLQTLVGCRECQGTDITLRDDADLG